MNVCAEVGYIFFFLSSFFYMDGSEKLANREKRLKHPRGIFRYKIVNFHSLFFSSFQFLWCTKKAFFLQNKKKKILYSMIMSYILLKPLKTYNLHFKTRVIEYPNDEKKKKNNSIMTGIKMSDCKLLRSPDFISLYIYSSFFFFIIYFHKRVAVK